MVTEPDVTTLASVKEEIDLPANQIAHIVAQAPAQLELFTSKRKQSLPPKIMNASMLKPKVNGNDADTQ